MTTDSLEYELRMLDGVIACSISSSSINILAGPSVDADALAADAMRLARVVGVTLPIRVIGGVGGGLPSSLRRLRRLRRPIGTGVAVGVGSLVAAIAVASAGGLNWLPGVRSPGPAGVAQGRPPAGSPPPAASQLPGSPVTARAPLAFPPTRVVPASPDIPPSADLPLTSTTTEPEPLTEAFDPANVPLVAAAAPKTSEAAAPTPAAPNPTAPNPAAPNPAAPNPAAPNPAAPNPAAPNAAAPNAAAPNAATPNPATPNPAAPNPAAPTPAAPTASAPAVTPVEAVPPVALTVTPPSGPPTTEAPAVTTTTLVVPVWSPPATTTSTTTTTTTTVPRGLTARTSTSTGAASTEKPHHKAHRGPEPRDDKASKDDKVEDRPAPAMSNPSAHR